MLHGGNFASQLVSVVSYRLGELTLPQLTLPDLGSALHRHRWWLSETLMSVCPSSFTPPLLKVYGAITSFPFPVIMFSEGRRPWISRFDLVHLPVTLEICRSNGLRTATGASCTAAGTVSLLPDEALKPST